MTVSHRAAYVMYGSTYVGGGCDHAVKPAMNDALKHWFREQGVSIRNTPRKDKIAVISGMWREGHSVYRIHTGFLEALRGKYELTLMHLGEEAEPATAMFDYLGTRIDGPRAGTAKIVINWRFDDSKEILAATLQHGALTTVKGQVDGDAETMVATSRRALEPVILGQKSLDQAIADGGITVIGNTAPLTDFWGLLVDFKSGIPLVVPR